MKKILHISANQIPDPYAKHHTVRIWEELAKGFDEYHIIGRSKNNRFLSIRKNNIVQHLVPALGKRNRSFFITSLYIFILIRRYNISHLLSQSSIWGGFSAALASRFFRIPHMVEIHGDVYFDYFTSKNLLKRVLGKISLFTLKNATRVRSLSPSMTRQLAANGLTSNVVEIPNRVDLLRFKPPKSNYTLSDPIQIISVGRFVKQKGYDLAIESILKLSSKLPIQLTLIGGGKLHSLLKEKSKNDPSIELIEWIDQHKLIDKLRSADIYIQPSLPFYGEAMPRTLLEAMAMGLPIIATSIGAIPGILNDDQNALLIPPKNQSALIASLEKLISDRSLRMRLGQQAFKDASNKYEWSFLFEKYRKEILDMS